MKNLLHLLFLISTACFSQRISDLPAATTPVAGTELTAIVQSGVTRKLPITDLVPPTGITYAKFQNLSGLSIFGRSANSSGVGADITAGSDGDVLRRSGTTLGFGAIPINSVTNLQTTIDAKVADAINNGTTTIAPSQNAVFDAIALKWGSLTTFRRLIVSASLDGTDLTNVNSGARYWIEMNSGSANTLTIVANSTQAFPIGATIKVSQYGGGTTSFVAAGGVTLRSSAGVLTIGNQFSTGILTKVDTDEWYLENGAPTVLSSTYTPTLTNVTNVAASTAYVTGYYRIGNAVTVYGKIDIDASVAASTATEVGISLPVASAMTLEEDLGGNAISDAIASLTARVKADATNDRASVVFKALSLTNDSYSFEFSYTVK